jgi:hypothetical protein
MKISDILTETFVNLLGDDPAKEKYADQVFDMIQAAYAGVGGQKGRGFASPQDMIDNIPMWKLVRRNGEIVAGGMYRDKGGRKRVASFSDGTPEGKAGVAEIMANDFERAYFEVSDRALGFIIKQVGVDFVKQYAKTPEEVKQISKDEILPVPEADPHVLRTPELKPYFYQRELAGHLHTKIMLGTTGNKIIVNL